MSSQTAYVFKSVLKKLKFFGFTRFCPICRSHVRAFRDYGLIPRQNALCPVCSSLERHRLVWVFFQKHTGLFDSKRKKMLHVAPERVFVRKLPRIPGLKYVSADLLDPNAMVKMDVTDVPYRDNSFDVIYCSHVLEHVRDDLKAMREFYRVLRRSGWAVLQVPIENTDATFEDPSIEDPAERERLFGQHDHVRKYGPDYETRLAAAGFKVRRINAVHVVGEQNVERMGIQKTEDIFYCEKR